MRVDSVQVDPVTSLEERQLRMLAPDLGRRMAVARGSLVGIVTKRDSLDDANEVFACQTK